MTRTPQWRRPPWTRWARRLRRHWLMVVLVVAGFTLRVLASVAYRPAILYIDSVAVYVQNLHSFHAVTPDPLGYDILLLRPVLAVGGLGTQAALPHLIRLPLSGATRAPPVSQGGWRP